MLSPRQERYGWTLPGTSLSRGSEDEKPWVQKWPCFVTATYLKISRKHLKQTNKAAAQHISHSSPSLTSPGIVKLGEENQQKVFYTVNRGKKSCTYCARGNWSPGASAAIRSARAGGSCLCCRSLWLPLPVWFQLRLVQHGADAGVQELSAVAHQQVSAELPRHWG